MTLVWILVWLVVLVLFLAILNLILDKLMPKVGLDQTWKLIILGIIGLACLIWFFSRFVGGPGF